MDKKPLIVVSICVVVLLVLGSLSNVVGYQSIQSTTVSNSPLFSMRTQRAINKGSKVAFISDYLGRGIDSNFQFPMRENKTIMLSQFIDRIRMMNENEFDRFQSVVILGLSEDMNNKNIYSNSVLRLLKQIWSNTNELNINQIDKNGNKNDPPTSFCVFTAGYGGKLICFFVYIIIDFLYMIIEMLPTIGSPPWCSA